MDEALTMLAPYGPSFRGGLSNHGPMTVEALVGLGREDAVLPWVERYRKRLEARPSTTRRITLETWREALGKGSRNRDWDEWFANELAEADWRDVLGVWMPRLAPGMAAAGLHGVIRVGHAVSSLKVKESALRLDELARALGYYASQYLALPGEYSAPGKLAPSSALGQLALLPNSQRRTRGLITSELGDLVGYEPFTEAIDLVDPAQGSPTFLADLVATSAGLLINTESSSFEFLHGVTGAGAVSEIYPYVPEAERALVLAYTWQVTASLFVRYGKPKLVAVVPAAASQLSLEALAKLAVESGDEHTIKLVCACTREWARNPDPRFLAAAQDRVQ